MLSIIFAIGFSLTGPTPHTVIPSTFQDGRVFAMPLVADSMRRMVLWLDTDGSGFIRSGVVNQLHLQTATLPSGPGAYLPRFDTPDFPAISDNHGALPVLPDADATSPVYGGIDGQLGASWFADRIWLIDYVGQQLWLDHATPAYRSADAVPLTFDRAHRVPRIDVSVDGKAFAATLDTAATVVLSEKAAAFLGPAALGASLLGAPARIRATSFIRASIAAQWHAAHPQWQYLREGGVDRGVSLIRVPEVRVARVVFHNVWFSTRPGDDVFAGDPVDMKLGPTAYGTCRVLLDYVHDISAFQC